MFPVGLPPPMVRRAQKHVPAAPVPYVGARASKIRYFTWYESAGRQEQARRDSETMSETLPMPAGDGRKWGDRWREYSTTFFEILPLAYYSGSRVLEGGFRKKLCCTFIKGPTLTHYRSVRSLRYNHTHTHTTVECQS